MEFREWVEENRQSFPFDERYITQINYPAASGRGIKTLIKEEIRIYVGVR